MKVWAEQPYQKIPEACRTTGLSQYMLRRGCRDGTVPHMRSGRTYYVNVPALLGKLAQSDGTVFERGCSRIQVQFNSKEEET